MIMLKKSLKSKTNSRKKGGESIDKNPSNKEVQNTRSVQPAPKKIVNRKSKRV